MIFLQSAGSNSRSGKRPCSLRGRFPVLENAPAVCTDIFPFWKMPLQSARTHSRSGKCPCSLQGHFPILESLPADCRKLFLTNFHILTCISTSSPLFSCKSTANLIPQDPNLLCLLRNTVAIVSSLTNDPKDMILVA